MNDIIAKGRWVLGWAGTVDFFESNRQVNMSDNDLIARIRDQVGDMPFRPLPLPRKLSQRPLFCGESEGQGNEVTKL